MGSKNFINLLEDALRTYRHGGKNFLFNLLDRALSSDAIMLKLLDKLSPDLIMAAPASQTNFNFNGLLDLVERARHPAPGLQLPLNRPITAALAKTNGDGGAH